MLEKTSAAFFFHAKNCDLNCQDFCMKGLMLIDKEVMHSEWVNYYLKWRVGVLWMDDINTTGDLGDDWHKIVHYVTAVSS